MRAALLTTAMVLMVLVWTWQDRIPEWLGEGTAAEATETAGADGPADVAAPPPGERTSPLPGATLHTAEAAPRDEPGYQTATDDVRPLPRTHTVTEGETLESIAQQYYGDPDRAEDVLEANREQSEDLDPLRAGTILTLP